MINKRGIIHLCKDSGHICATNDKPLDYNLAALGSSLGFAANFLGDYW